jgi:hypothetical protein
VTRLLKLANCVGVHGSLRGQIFENRMLDVLGSPGSVVVKRKSESSSPPSELSINLTGDSVAFGPRSLLPGQLQVGVVYTPVSKTNEAWDAFLLLPTGEVCLLQYTIARDHPVSRKGLTKGLELVQSRDIAERGRIVRSAGKAEALKSRLVFVVPPTTFPLFGVPQEVKKVDGDEAKRRIVDCQEVWQVDQKNGVPLW